MTQLPISSSTVIYSSPSHFGPGPGHRLIVLVPAGSDHTSMISRISALAITSGAHVLFLGLSKDPGDDLSLRRELVTLSALMQDAHVCAEVQVEAGTNWVEAVKSSYRPGDGVVCFAERYVGLRHRPLSQILSGNLGAPVYVLSTLSPESPAGSGWLSRITAWAGSIGMIAGFFLLQIQLMSVPNDWVQTILLVGSVIAELWLIWLWNGWFG